MHIRLSVKTALAIAILALVPVGASVDRCSDWMTVLTHADHVKVWKHWTDAARDNPHIHRCMNDMTVEALALITTFCTHGHGDESFRIATRMVTKGCIEECIVAKKCIEE